MPLNGSENRRHVIRRAPAVLKNVQTQLARAIHVWVEHLTDELDPWRLVWICLFEMHHKAKGAIFKRGVRRSDDDGVPGTRLDTAAR